VIPILPQQPHARPRNHLLLGTLPAPGRAPASSGRGACASQEGSASAGSGARCSGCHPLGQRAGARVFEACLRGPPWRGAEVRWRLVWSAMASPVCSCSSPWSSRHRRADQRHDGPRATAAASRCQEDLPLVLDQAHQRRGQGPHHHIHTAPAVGCWRRGQWGWAK